MSAKSPQPVLSPIATPRVRRTQGIALVVVLLSAMVLMVSLLAVTSTMVVSSQRTTSDQGVTLQAQYAAEAGIARTEATFAEIDTLMSSLLIPVGTLGSAVRPRINDFCGGNAGFPFPSSTYDYYSSWTAAEKANGIKLCEGAALEGGDSSRYSLFTNTTYLPEAKYPAGVTNRVQYWQNAFSGSAGGTSVSAKVATDAASGAESWYTVNYGLTPTKVVLWAPDLYRIYFTLTQSAVGEVRAGGSVVSSRRLVKDVSKEFYLQIGIPSFAKYVLFRNRTTSTSGGQLYFAGGETFNGPVHTNGRPAFYKINGVTPVFSDTFTTAAAYNNSNSSTGMWRDYPAAADQLARQQSADFESTFTNEMPNFGTDNIPMVTNKVNQLNAALGKDSKSTARATNTEIRTAFGITTAPATTVPTGVYSSHPSSTTWPNGNGGIYVKGDVSSLKLSTVDSRQVIEVKQGATTATTTTTTFTENTNGSWTVSTKVGTAAATNKTLTGKFNGMIYVEGGIADLGGDGTAAPDIAKNSQLTLTTATEADRTGAPLSAIPPNVIIKRDLTYEVDATQETDPTTGQMPQNVLGIYSVSGSTLLNGPQNKDLTVHASIMASHPGDPSKGIPGKGFGTVEATTVLKGLVPVTGQASRKARINLLGGIIEDTSQTVGTTGAEGYARNYNYDRRFKTGFTPPFFPLQENWETVVDPFARPVGLWQPVKGS